MNIITFFRLAILFEILWGAQAWVKISDKVAGDNFKYLDYFSVVGRDNKCIDLREENILNNLESLVNNYKPISYDPEPLKRSFPVLF